MIQKFDEFNSNPINEGVLQNIIMMVGLLVGTYGTTKAQEKFKYEQLPYDQHKIELLQNAMEDPTVLKVLKRNGIDDNNINIAKNVLKDFDSTQVRYKERVVSSENDLKRLLKAGYHLTSIQVDELLESTDLNIEVTQYTLELDLGENFNSGGFELLDREIIKDSLKSITSNAILLGIRIESSTDKQRLTPKLDNKLKDLGYNEGGNLALSKARNDEVKKALLEFGVSDTIIIQEYKKEQGDEVVDRGSRYVKIHFDVMDSNPLPIGDVASPSRITNYHLFKAVSKPNTKKEGTVKIKKGNSKLKVNKKMPVKKYNTKKHRCKQPK
jgi:hypothetical protein